jgi:hypothetical protein
VSSIFKLRVNSSLAFKLRSQYLPAIDEERKIDREREERGINR